MLICLFRFQILFEFRKNEWLTEWINEDNYNQPNNNNKKLIRKCFFWCIKFWSTFNYIYMCVDEKENYKDNNYNNRIYNVWSKIKKKICGTKYLMVNWKKKHQITHKHTLIQQNRNSIPNANKQKQIENQMFEESFHQKKRSQQKKIQESNHRFSLCVCVWTLPKAKVKKNLFPSTLATNYSLYMCIRWCVKFWLFVVVVVVVQCDFVSLISRCCYNLHWFDRFKLFFSPSFIIISIITFIFFFGFYIFQIANRMESRIFIFSLSIIK